MAKLVVAGAQCQCSMGSSPGKISVLPGGSSQGADQPVADVQCIKPQVNLAPFGMCQSMSNPQVAAATAAANGVLTPQPCMPNVAAPWSPGSSTTTADGNAALTDSDTCNCAFGGSITVTDAGQTIIDVE